MKNKLNQLAAAAAGLALVLSGTAFAAGISVAAQATAGGIGVAVSANASVIQKAQARADQEITRRINALNAASTRVNAMVKLTSDEKTSLSASIAAQISTMQTLQTQIAADASSSSKTALKADIQSITKSYRIFALIIPQAALDAASDRVIAVGGSITSFAAQLQTRVTAAQTAGTNMDTSVTALADLSAKVADSNTQANAAVTEISGLKPDNGDATVMASNTATLKDARTKIQASQQDLVAARKDAGTVLKALLALTPSGSASASSTVTASTTAQ